MKTFLGFCLGLILGAVAMFSVDSSWARPLERRTLTRDVNIGQECYRKGQTLPVDGVVKKGSKFQVQGIKGGTAYVAFETNVAVDRLNEFSAVLPPVE
jgi:hypothetical protein